MALNGDPRQRRRAQAFPADEYSKQLLYRAGRHGINYQYVCGCHSQTRTYDAILPLCHVKTVSFIVDVDLSSPLPADDFFPPLPLGAGKITTSTNDPADSLHTSCRQISSVAIAQPVRREVEAHNMFRWFEDRLAPCPTARTQPAS